MQGALEILRKGERYLLGVESKKQISFSYKKPTQKWTQRRVGEMNGGVTLLWPTVLQYCYCVTLSQPRGMPTSQSRFQ